MGICRAYGRLKEYHMLKFKDLKVGMRLRRLDNDLGYKHVTKNNIYEIKGIFPEDHEYEIVSNTGNQERFYFRDSRWELAEHILNIEGI